MNTPRISIVATVYNKGRFIGETLASALKQAERDLELIVVNDGSTDCSLDVVREIADTDSRVRVVDQQNAGAAVARNRGFENATGRFVVFLDGDDLLHEDFVRRASGALDQSGADVVHTSWQRIDESGRVIEKIEAPDPPNYLKQLLLGMLFAPTAMMFRRSLVERVGGWRDGFNPTEDWEFVLRCAKSGARFVRVPEVLASYREVRNSHRKASDRQSNRFFPVIDAAFDGTMAPEYERLKPLSIARHHLFLAQDSRAWGDDSSARRHLATAIQLVGKLELRSHEDALNIAQFMPTLGAGEALRLVRALRHAGAPASAYSGYVKARVVPAAVKNGLKRIAGGTYPVIRRAAVLLDERMQRVRRMSGYRPYDLSMDTGIAEIRERTLAYMRSMRLTKGSEFAGYRHSASRREPVLYATVAALLLKHLYHTDENVDEELAYLARFQRPADGLFIDPVIACDTAEREDWWGWRHLTLHALMTLAVYGKAATHPVRYPETLGGPDGLRSHLRARDWGARAAWTSNEVQNLGVMFQYARDFQGSATAQKQLDVMYDVMEENQDRATGLYGSRFQTAEDLSNGVQAGYHFWLLYFYDKRPIPHADQIIEQVLRTQNALGGYGVKWNSSACEDIDSVDPLVRLRHVHPSFQPRLQASLQRALPAILQNLNADGGWVFRRHESLTVGHPAMFSAENESNMLYTWFRTLGLAYCLCGLDDVPPQLRFKWNFCWAPGHQFL